MLNPYSIAGTVLVLVALAGGWRAWWKQAQESGFMDRALRKAGHVPPETDPERTAWIPVVVDDDLACGAHSLRSQSLRVGTVNLSRSASGWLRVDRIGTETIPYRGHHHMRIGCLTVAALQRRLAVPA